MALISWDVMRGPSTHARGRGYFRSIRSRALLIQKMCTIHRLGCLVKGATRNSPCFHENRVLSNILIDSGSGGVCKQINKCSTYS